MYNYSSVLLDISTSLKQQHLHKTKANSFIHSLWVTPHKGTPFLTTICCVPGSV